VYILHIYVCLHIYVYIDYKIYIHTYIHIYSICGRWGGGRRGGRRDGQIEGSTERKRRRGPGRTAEDADGSVIYVLLSPGFYEQQHHVWNVTYMAHYGAFVVLDNCTAHLRGIDTSRFAESIQADSIRRCRAS